MAHKTKTFIKAQFEAGDRPTDQTFIDLFDSIVFIGEANANVLGTQTGIAGNVGIGGVLSLTGNFELAANFLVGDTTQTSTFPIQAYTSANETVIFASGSQSNILFEGISADSTSSIKLEDDITNVRFGTHTGKGFLEVHGQEIITYSTGSASGLAPVSISGSVGIGTITTERTLHIVGDGIKVDNGSSPSVLELFGATDWRVQGGTNFIIYDVTNAETPFTIEAGAGNNTLVLDANDRVGIGTDSPNSTLDVRGDVVIGATPAIKLFDDNNIATNPDILLKGDALIAAEDNFLIAIDSDNGSTNAKFSIIKNAQSSSGSPEEIFKVTEDGTVSASLFQGDGSGLSGITSTQIDLFGGGPAENELVTVNSAGTGLDAESQLTFNGEKFNFTLLSGNTNEDGLEILSPANDGELKLINNVTSSDQFYPHVKGRASSGLTGAGIGGLMIEGRPAIDNINNPGIVLKSVDATSLSVAESSPVLRASNFDQHKFQIGFDGGVYIGDPTANTPELVGGFNLQIRGGAGSIANTHLSGSALLIGNTSTGLGMDTNEIYYNGIDGIFGTLSNHDLFIKTNATTRMTILNDGKVGIGVTNPDEQLSVAGGNIEVTTTGRIGFNVSDTIGSYTAIQDDGTTATATDQVAHYGLSRTDTAIFDPVVLSGYYGLEFATNGNKRIRINQNGKVGIGTDTPVNPLSIHAISDNTDVLEIFNTSGTGIIELSSLTGGHGLIDIRNSSETVNVRLHTNGTSYFKGGDFVIGSTTALASAKLSVYSTVDIVAAFKTTDDGASYILTDTSTADGDTHSAVIFRENGSNKGAVGWNAANSTINLRNGTGINSGGGLDIYSDGDAVFSNNVGIGTTDPSEALVINNGKISLTGDGLTPQVDNEIKFQAGNDNASIRFEMYKAGVNSSPDGGRLRIQTGDNGDGGNAEEIILSLAVTGGTREGFRMNKADKIIINGGKTGSLGNHVDFSSTNFVVKQTDQSEAFSEAARAIGIVDNDTDKFFTMGYNSTSGDNLLFGFNTNESSFQACGTLENEEGNTIMNFTGQHRVVPGTGNITDYSNYIGHIVSANGEYDNIVKPGFENTHNKNTPNIDESLPKIILSNIEKDKRVFGVVSEIEDPNDPDRTHKVGKFKTIHYKDTSRIIVNSLGEGAIAVCDYNGNLENGDYITTSPISGIGMKQDDDLLHNYTVAKITEDCDFSSGTTQTAHNGQAYKWKLVGCTYHCG